jgi:hypothetical protein
MSSDLKEMYWGKAILPSRFRDSHPSAEHPVVRQRPLHFDFEKFAKIPFAASNVTDSLIAVPAARESFQRRGRTSNRSGSFGSPSVAAPPEQFIASAQPFREGNSFVLESVQGLYSVPESFTSGKLAAFFLFLFFFFFVSSRDFVGRQDWPASPKSLMTTLLIPIALAIPWFWDVPTRSSPPTL